MKSRGYGLPKRTAFSLFRFTLRDGICLGVLATLGGIVLAGGPDRRAEMVVLSAPGGATGAQAAVWTAAFVLLAAFPLIFDAKEATMAGITVSHLSFTYPQETVPALRDVSFSVEEGEFLTVIGRPAAANQRCCAR